MMNQAELERAYKQWSDVLGYAETRAESATQAKLIIEGVVAGLGLALGHDRARELLTDRFDQQFQEFIQQRAEQD